jgi:electron transport complex protein RnfG
MPREASTSSLRMILTMAAIGLACAVLIVFTFQVTFSRIENNKRIALEKAVFEVVPGAVEKVTFAVVDGTLRPLAPGTDAVEKYYACYDADGELVGVAIEASGQGFQDVLRLLYGYSPREQAIVGLKVLESKETPGLGDKIESDARFKSNFEALNVEIAGGGLVHPIELVKHGEKTDDWQVEAITGATISSRAVATILGKSAATSVPLVSENVPALEEGSQ